MDSYSCTHLAIHTSLECSTILTRLYFVCSVHCSYALGAIARVRAHTRYEFVRQISRTGDFRANDRHTNNDNDNRHTNRLHIFLRDACMITLLW